MCAQNLSDDATEVEPILLQGARAAVATAVAALSQAVLFGLNNTRLVRDERHARLVELMRDRRVCLEECEDRKHGCGQGGG